MKRLFLIAVLFCVAVSCAPKDANQRLAEQAAKEYLTPVHPGNTERPFWNGFAKKFIYAPAFDFQAVEGATEYLYKVTSEVGEWNFKAESPQCSLAPIWNEIPQGTNVTLTVEGIDA